MKPLARVNDRRDVHEETINKDTQTTGGGGGGATGFSLKPGADSRYYLTSEYRGSYYFEGVERHGQQKKFTALQSSGPTTKPDKKR